MKLFTVSAVSAVALFGSIAPVSAQVPGAAAVTESAARVNEVNIDKVTTDLVNTPEFQITGGQNKRYEIKKWLEVEWEYATPRGRLIDEVTFAVTLQIGGKLVPGTVTYTKIPEGKHFGVMYIAPRALESVTGGRAVTGQAVEGVWISATSSQGVAVAQYAAKRGSQPPNLPRVDGLLLKKPETPFAPLYWDRYEAIKASR